MADAVVDLAATDVFALGGNFHAQRSSSIHSEQPAQVLDALGNSQCETMIDAKTDYEADYEYCNVSPAIGTDLGAFLTSFGAVSDGKLVTSLEIGFSAGKQATVKLKGHNHDTNAHATGTGVANVSEAVPATSGFGVPTFAGVTTGTVSTPIEATLTFEMNHVDKVGSAGTHFVGKNITPKATLTVKYQGVPSVAQPMTGWTTDTYGPADDNKDFDTYIVTAHRYFDLA
jgi:hypothetical protein